MVAGQRRTTPGGGWWRRRNGRRVPGRQVAERTRTRRADTFSYDAREVLQRVWVASGGQCGKYLAASMRTQHDELEHHGRPMPGQGRDSAEVRAELLAMRAASIDRYLAPARAEDQLRGQPTTKGSPLLPRKREVPQAGGEIEEYPGFVECYTVAHGWARNRT